MCESVYKEQHKNYTNYDKQFILVSLRIKWSRSTLQVKFKWKM